ncbi:MAG: NAD-dependent deacylase [Dethiobacter sp.]|jgi:NAD-dependent deacetylase|nr:NAD-dependent deacylase [Dethiobacter sp.]
MEEKIARLIKESKRCFAFTGAGISTESGIPDFRTPGSGLWEKVDPTKYATSDVLMNSPELFWRNGFTRYKQLLQAVPNPGHYALAAMEEMGLLSGLITQNIDNLHYKAGSRKIYEVHGHIRTCRCTSCRSHFEFNVLLEQLDRDIIPPLCEACEKPLRPDIVLFGDQMADDYLSALDDLSFGCDLMLVVGSSLAVYPAADMPRLADKLVIINKMPTPLDGRAVHVMHTSSGEVLAKIAAILQNSA